MVTLISLLVYLVSAAFLVCQIMVLLKLFPAEGTVKGILGILCGLYTFIWGWMNKDKFGLDMIMKAWTAIFVALIVLEIVLTMVATHH